MRLLRSTLALAAAGVALGAMRPPAPPKTVAVLYFDNYTGKPDYDALGKGIASMMTTDLSSVQQLTMVERDRLQDVVAEQKLQQSKLSDSTTAVKMGHLVGAQYVVTGSIAAVEPKIRLDTRVISVENGTIVKAAQVTGNQDDFFRLEQDLAHRLIDGLQVALSPEDRQRLQQQQEKDRIDHLSTMVQFSQALALRDQGDYLGAATRMRPVVQSAPHSLLVQMTMDEIQRRAASSAKESAKEKLRSGIGHLFGRP